MNRPPHAPGPLGPEEVYEVVTADGWTLAVTRFPGPPEAERRPPAAPRVDDQPILLLHGFSQNRLAWTSGGFIPALHAHGFDVHVLELRGHGRSSIARQRALARAVRRPLPVTLDYLWDFSDYWLHDVPAALDAVKARTGARRVALCGHSMGGLIGYALAARRDDLLCLGTVGSPADVGAESLLLRAAARAEGLVPWVQRGLRGYEALRRAATSTPLGHLARRLPATTGGHFPSDLLLGTVYRLLLSAHERAPYWVPRGLRLFNPERARPEDVKWLLRFGEEREPLAVTRTFLRWIRRGELVDYRTGFDIRAGFQRIRVPVVIYFGTQDILGGPESTRPARHRVASEYVVWEALDGAAHIDITMGRGTDRIAAGLARAAAHALAHPAGSPRG